MVGKVGKLGIGTVIGGTENETLGIEIPRLSKENPKSTEGREGKEGIGTVIGGTV